MIELECQCHFHPRLTLNIQYADNLPEQYETNLSYLHSDHISYMTQYGMDAKIRVIEKFTKPVKAFCKSIYSSAPNLKFIAHGVIFDLGTLGEWKI